MPSEWRRAAEERSGCRRISSNPASSSRRLASSNRALIAARRGSGRPSTRSRIRRASTSEIGTSWRQHAPQPFRHEIVRPCASTDATTAPITRSASDWNRGNISTRRAGAVATVTVASSRVPATVRATSAETVSGAGVGSDAMAMLPWLPVGCPRRRLLLVPRPEFADAPRPTADGPGDARRPEPGEPADQEPMPAPEDPLIDQRIEPDRQEEQVLHRAEQQVPGLRERPAEPARLEGIAEDAQSHQHEQAAPGDPRRARQGPDRADDRQVGKRLAQEGRQREPAPDLIPPRMPVQEPAEAPRLVHVRDDVMAQPDRIARLARPEADGLVLGQQVADPR